MQPDVYLFGQILGTHSFLLRDGFLQPDEYAEIEAKYFLPGGEMLFARRGEPIQRMKPFDVTVKSTLGAGDTFKAGCVYGLLAGFGDRELVRFASACSGIAVSRFPPPLNPPKLAEVEELMRSQK